MHHFRRFLFASIFWAANTALAECPLEGVWRTDVERSAQTVWASKSIEEKKKQPIVSILDEFQWEVTCDAWIVRHVGDHKFSEPVPDELHTYRVELLPNSRLRVTLTDVETPTPFELTFDELGCIEIRDEARDMTEFKCRVK